MKLSDLKSIIKEVIEESNFSNDSLLTCAAVVDVLNDTECAKDIEIVDDKVSFTVLGSVYTAKINEDDTVMVSDVDDDVVASDLFFPIEFFDYIQLELGEIDIDLEEEEISTATIGSYVQPQPISNVVARRPKGKQFEEAYVDKEMATRKKLAIKQAFPAKDGWKISISVSNHSSLNIVVLEAPYQMLTNPDDDDREVQLHSSHNIETSTRITDEAKKDLTELYRIADEGNHDNSDMMTDYFDVGFYLSVYVGQWNKPFKVAGTESNPNVARIETLVRLDRKIKDKKNFYDDPSFIAGKEIIVGMYEDGSLEDNIYKIPTPRFSSYAREIRRYGIDKKPAIPAPKRIEYEMEEESKDSLYWF